MNLELGQRVIALRETGVCDKGERGVVYEIYELEGRGGASVIFEKGRYDGFSEKEQALMLEALEEECPFARTYAFQNVGRLANDYRAGRFTFSTEEEKVRPEVRAALIRDTPSRA